MKKKYLGLVLLAAVSVSVQAQKPGVFKGQEPIKGVSTTDKPVEKQWKGVFKTPGGNLFFGNDFDGARLNGVTYSSDSGYVLSINPENTPINGSPWYAFKVWSAKPEQVKITFKYPEPYKHRYEPKISHNGRDWSEITAGKKGNATYDLAVGPDTVWVAAQELLTSKDALKWAGQLKSLTPVKKEVIGKTHLQKELYVFTAGNPDSKKHLLIFGRQHPPEVTGQLAMQAFVEALLSSGKLSKQLLKGYQVHVIPLLNPDGVDGGFWRHSFGGVDLNRDWAAFNQPETKAVRDYLKKTVADQGGQLVFAIDFHSTHDDIYYIVDPKLKSKYPGLIDNWLKNTVKNIPDYVPNIKPLYEAPPTYTSFSYLFETYGTEALVYEIGDKTGRDFIKQKAAVSAVELIKLLAEKEFNKK